MEPTFLSLDNMISFFAMIISFGSLVAVILNNRKKQNSDQFRITLDINYKIEDIDNKLSNLFKNDILSNNPNDQINFQNSMEDLFLEKLNTLEFFSLLINKKEITNKSIINYFKPTLIDDSFEIFKAYPKLESNEKKYQELKKLLKKFNDGKFDE